MANKSYSMVIDLHRCVGCAACDIACKSENNLPDDFHWSNHIIETSGVFPNVRYRYIPTLCNHCENAPCVAACPTKAMHKSEDGLTLHEQRRLRPPREVDRLIVGSDLDPLAEQLAQPPCARFNHHGSQEVARVVEVILIRDVPDMNDRRHLDGVTLNPNVQKAKGGRMPSRRRRVQERQGESAGDRQPESSPTFPPSHRADPN